ncbi:MAG: PEP-CTERM sorting domain-containing protein [Microcoleus sp.]
MNQKQRQKLARAIGTTVLSCAALLLATVDKVQAAILTYNFGVGGGGPSGSFKFNNTSLTNIGVEQLAVSEGKLNNFTASFSNYGLQGKDYYDLAGAIALFYQGEFRGLQASGNDSSISEINIPAGAPGGPYSIKYEGRAFWSMDTNGLTSPNMWTSYFSGYREVLITPPTGRPLITDRTIINDREVSYTLVAVEPIPEPVTIAGTALAIAGLSWLKHKKKTAV